MTRLKSKSEAVRNGFIVALVCVSSLSACHSGGGSGSAGSGVSGGSVSGGSGAPASTNLSTPAEGIMPAFYKDAASGIEIRVPSGWNPHQFLGGTIAFSPTPDDGYKARAYIQRQDPAIGGNTGQHLKAAEMMLKKKKYATFEVVSREIKSPFNKEYGELIYKHRTNAADPMLTDSLCVIPVSESRWVILQCSAATSAFDRWAPQFDLIKKSLSL